MRYETAARALIGFNEIEYVLMSLGTVYCLTF